jgi:hypothetical protein
MLEFVLPVLGALIAIGGFALGIWIVRTVERRIAPAREDGA